MIFRLSSSFRKYTAATLLMVHSAGIITPVFAAGSGTPNTNNGSFHTLPTHYLTVNKANTKQPCLLKPVTKLPLDKVNITHRHYDKNVLGIGGPSQPEMSSFKSIDADNMVNLFTGDFSYNIPLMDVGGYPVNIFYDGSIGMEQEASWVGLGWNINPGTINRNMRGVPDDFSGTDNELMEQTQVMKPNVTWGARFGPDFEFSGLKAFNFGADLGVSVNNYLGPAVELGIKGSVNLSLAKNTAHEKTASLNLGLNANASSRGGLTISGNASLSANAFTTTQGGQGGVGLRLGTSYNSRSGIKELQLSEQMSFNKVSEAKAPDNSNRRSSIGESLASTTISFAKPSYIPSIRMPVTNSSFSGHFQLGGALWGNYASGEVEVYKQKSEVAPEDVTTKKPMVGYLHYQNALNNDNAVMDFTRFNDNEVTSKTPIISAPQYSYDVFSIQGEGTGGSIRAYRNDLGYVRDNYTHSRDKNFSAGGDVGVPGHIGANFNMIKTPTSTGEWKDGNNLKTALAFGGAASDYENVYFRNPGENSVLNTNQYNRIGGEELVRFKLGASATNPSISTTLEKFDKSGSKISVANGGEVNITTTPDITGRKKRTQVINFLTAEEASLIGLDKKIKSYKDVSSEGGFLGNILQPTEISRVGGYRGAKHISQINVTEANGRRYIYGIPVYNRTQQDFTFSVANTEIAGADGEDKVLIAANETALSSPHLSSSSSNKDGYLQITTTPAYSHSFLLSGLLSPDYVDVLGDGITEDDLGTAVKFNYTKIDGFHNWRTPSTRDDNIANFNPGKLTETKDDKGIISSGERESWYMHSIESKTMIAVFKLENRNDGKGVSSYLSGVNETDNTQKLLRRIDLYSKADLYKNGLTGAKPIKTVNFVYDYSLCKGTPDNKTSAPDNGKLTLKSIYFTYNGQARTNTSNNRSKYVFGYENAGNTGNPDYKFNASDRWGTYKRKEDNPNPQLKNALYPYSAQVKTTADENAGAWSLKKILLPSGGQIEVTYESDDYAFVQNKRAANMMEIYGFSNTSSLYAIRSNLYDIDYLNKRIIENNFVFVKVTEALLSSATPTDAEKTAATAIARNKYLSGLSQLAFKLAVYMPKGGVEYITCYAELADQNNNFGILNDHTLWIQLKPIDGISPLSLTTIEYLREQLPGQAYQGYDVSESTGLAQVGEMFKGLLSGIRDAFTDPITSLRLNDHKAQTVELTKSYVRLNNPSGKKLGGGQRVSAIKLKDNWKAMTNQYTSEYGHTYEYTTTEVFNGATRTISSGVASYEPSLGGEENPFHTILSVANKLPLGPASYGAIEMPVLDAFFPAPSVGYSKVTVTSLKKKNAAGQFLSGVGKQVTEFYTAKDFPVYYNNTSLDPSSDLQYHQSSFGAFFYKSASDSRAVSQGFLVATNDMHGKMKSQTSYAENDDKTPISYTENFYRNTGVKGLDEKFDFVSAANGGAVSEGNMGIDIELMTDTREFSVKSTSLEIQGQLDLFPVILPFWLPFIWPVVGKTDNTYRAVTTTKVISYHSIIDSVVVIDKGSQVSTKNLVYDAETGDVIVNRTNNEFNRPVYNTSYPAWWAYSGMGLAYKNIDAVYSANFRDGKITSISPASSTFESGDELYLTNPGTSPTDNCASALNLESATLLWAFNKNKNTSSLTDPTPDFVFIDSKGRLYSKNNVTFKIVRSGKRNLLDAKAATVTTMVSPVAEITAATPTTPAVYKLKIDASNNAAATKTINATAVEFKEKWQFDNDIINRYRLSYSSLGKNLITNGDFENGNPGVNSGYIYSPTISPIGSEGTYTIGSNPQDWNVYYSACNDHTSGTGNMMIVNGSTQPNTIVWHQIIQVVPNTDYDFSFWLQPVVNETAIGLTRLSLSINSSSAGILELPNGNACSWNQFTKVWNSGNNTSANISIINLNTESYGNDFAIDDLFFAAKSSCTPHEIADCEGYLEKSINPYRKGLLGTFRPFQNKVFYDYRQQTDPASATNISTDGSLSNFKLYWNFNSSNNLAPDINSKQWVFQSQTTKTNSKGLELETKDANDIYTAAQYGFNKTVPLALTNNAQYSEMFNEGFEDHDFKNNINTIPGSICHYPQIDFSGMNKSNIISFNDNISAAHTGKYVLQVDGTSNTNIPSIATKSFLINSNNHNDYSLIFDELKINTLNDAGINIAPDYSHRFDPDLSTLNPNFSIDNFSSQGSNELDIRVTSWFYEYDFPQPSIKQHFDYNLSGDGYIKIDKDGLYNIKVNSPSNSSSSFDYYFGGCGNGSVTVLPFYPLNFGLTNIADNTAVSTTFISEDASYEGEKIYSACLTKGIYKLNYYIERDVDYASNICSNPFNDVPTVSEAYKLKIFNANSTNAFYKTLSTTQTNCGHKPIPANLDMVNSTFSIPPDKKMLFSAWVKQNCGTNICTNKVTIDFGSGNSANTEFKPTGPVIEGWQKIEGDFTAPLNATTATLSLINTSTQPIFFDDIRIHPFNANMKSYVYDPVNLRLTAELDANNYAKFYEYDEEGTLIRTKAETKEGIKTITETRSAKQRVIADLVNGNGNIAPAITSIPILPNANASTPYNYSFDITGTPQLTLVNIVKPNWMNIAINNSNNKIIFSGTPSTSDIVNNQNVSFDIDNGNTIKASFSTTTFSVQSALPTYTISLQNTTTYGSGFQFTVLIDGTSYNFPSSGVILLPISLTQGSHSVKFNCGPSTNFRITPGTTFNCTSTPINWNFTSNTTFTVY